MIDKKPFIEFQIAHYEQRLKEEKSIPALKFIANQLENIYTYYLTIQ